MMRVHQRWFLARDLAACFAHARENHTGWQATDLAKHMQHKSGAGYVAESWHTGEVVGCLLYSFRRGCLELQYVCVAAGYQRGGVGRQMVERLQQKCRDDKRPALVMDVDEDNLRGQLFLRSLGFKARQQNERDQALGVFHFVWKCSDESFEDPGAWDFEWWAEVEQTQEEETSGS